MVGVNMYVSVALDVPLPRLFDYALPSGSVAQLGQRVVVQFGPQKLIGVVLALTRQASIELSRIKTVEALLDDVTPLSAELLALLQFCSQYYCYPIGQTVMAALPSRLRSLQPLKPLREDVYQLSALGLTIEPAQIPKRKRIWSQLMPLLAAAPQSLKQLRLSFPSATNQLKELQALGWVECQQRQLAAAPSPVIELQQAHQLNAEQQAAVDAVLAATAYQCFLLHGITGSGKTEVFVHLMYQILRQGGQVLLLVPEINLTPQLEAYFYRRFPMVSLVSLHSGLSENQRIQNWQAAQVGSARLILGTRLAVFTELPLLKLIIVDEAHDASFKQQDGLRYSARDVAVFRASRRQIPVVLASATPALENYYQAQMGRYRLLSLTQRANVAAKLPEIRCVNVNQTTLHSGVSENLLRAIEQRLDKQEQSLVFINRRGYAPVVLCRSCGWLSNCKNCAGKMVLHLKERKLRCHHCGFAYHVPAACPDCGSVDLHPVGSGTQRVEEVLQERLPQARILRVDRDSTRSAQQWQQMRAQIERQEVDILVGTQMLAKGHDFPALTLVGVLNADSGLYSGDFRASETLFAQLAQVAGRAGRSERAGEVIIQTAYPDHPLFRFLKRHDFNGWAAVLLDERRLAGFPPFMFQLMLRAEAEQEGDAWTFLSQARRLAQDLDVDNQLEILGVVPATLSRRANVYRLQLLLQASNRKVLQQFLPQWAERLPALNPKRLRYHLDIDPQTV